MKALIKLFNWLSERNEKVNKLRSILRRRWMQRLENQRFKKSVRQQLYSNVKPVDKGINRQRPPIILISACRDKQQGGEFYKYNGGGKLANLWVKLLRAHGYEAYMVTYSGGYQPWLIEHQPHISLDTVKHWKNERRHLKFVTGWLPSTAFINLADQLYFIDAEIAWTSGVHLPILRKLLRSKIRAIVTNSRTQQAWYMATFNRNVALIQDWSDEAYWYPKLDKREEGLVGYMLEGPDSDTEIKQIASYCQQKGVNLEFVQIAGDEGDVLEAMRRCDFYLGLNTGKDVLWGEGSPRSPQEAMHCGCVVIAYDVHGNREYLIDGYSGFLSPRKRPDLIADHLIQLAHNPALKEQVRATSTDLAARAFTSQAHWPLLRDFLELDELEIRADISTGSHAPYVLKKADLKHHLGAPAHIAEEEIPVFARYASLATDTLVEIGAAHGASAVLMLANAQASAAIHSIDPFIPDSMGSFRASPSECRRNVSRALKSMRIPHAIDRWHLHVQPSYELVRTWDKPIDLLYIDGDHTYEAVRKDFDDWFPHVRRGGWILLHDSRRENGAPEGVFERGWPGPTQLAEELKVRPDLELVHEAYSLTVWRHK